MEKMSEKLLTALRQKLVTIATAMLQLERRQKRLVVLGFDVVFCFAAIFIAFSLRVGALAFPIRPPLIFASVAVPLFILLFYLTGVYSTIFRFVGSRSIFQLAKATVIYSLPLISIFVVWSVPQIPRTVAVLHPMIFFGLASISRIFVRHFLIEVVLPDQFVGGISRVLIYGAGSAGQQLATALRHEPGLLPVGFIDDDKRLHLQKLDGLPICHSADLADVVQRKQVDMVLLALPSVSRARRRQIVEDLRPLNLHVRTLPNMSDLVGGEVSISDLRDIQIEDLLGRDPVKPNDILMGRTIVGKTVLVTGAGGSIGSELCRQIVNQRAGRLILFDFSEFALYQIDIELSQICRENGQTELEIVPVLGSVTDQKLVRRVFNRWQPDTVFHAAAYKHVPLVELNRSAGMRNNILGTQVVVDESEKANVADFTLVSTDKAVRPTNIMGASKRTAELIVQAYAEVSRATRYSIVRFGNVLGSSGSVVPLFRQQIEAGGPITLTHREVTRFFMTIPEAAQLVIQAGGMARGGEVFVLDMGKPVKIYDLAKSMIELSGLTVSDNSTQDGDIEIVEVGLRPGEKLHEELLIGERPQATKHERIKMARERFLVLAKLEPLLRELAAGGDRDQSLALLKRLVPEFVHQRDNNIHVSQKQ